jgi:hypothetical protein
MIASSRELAEQAEQNSVTLKRKRIEEVTALLDHSDTSITNKTKPTPPRLDRTTRRNLKRSEPTYNSQAASLEHDPKRLRPRESH